MIFDTHAHYDDEAFDNDREALLAELPAKGITRVVNIGADMASSRRTVELAAKYDFVYGAIGVHPDNTEGLTYKDYSELEAMLRNERIVAIGEIGLDYYWDRNRHELQKEAFENQWDIADAAGVPVVIHSRDAAEDTYAIVRKRFERARAEGRELKAVMHCYSYSTEQAREYISMGLYLGIGGVVTFKNAKKLKEVVCEIPADRILLETDCPYLAPEPNRGKRNDSANLSYVAEAIAQLRGTTREEIERITFENAVRFYGCR